MTWCTYMQSFEKIQTDGGCCNISRPGPSARRVIIKIFCWTAFWLEYHRRMRFDLNPQTLMPSSNNNVKSRVYFVSLFMQVHTTQCDTYYLLQEIQGSNTNPWIREIWHIILRINFFLRKTILFHLIFFMLDLFPTFKFFFFGILKSAPSLTGDNFDVIECFMTTFLHIGLICM